MKRSAEKEIEIDNQSIKHQKIMDINIFEAAQTGDSKAIFTYRMYGGDVNIFNNVGKTPLMIAACAAHLQAIQMLYNMGALLDFPSKIDDTALILATECGQIAAMQLLIHLGANLEMKNDCGYTAVMMAIIEKQPAAFNILFEFGANIIGDSPGDGFTPFMLAARYGQTDALIKIGKKLIELGIDIRTELENINENNRTPLMEAAANGDIETIRALIEIFGADVNFGEDNSAIIEASEHGHINAIEVLVALGANINEVKKGNTALSWGLYNHDVIKTLVKLGGNPNEQITFHYAKKMGCLDAIQLLVKLAGGKDKFLPTDLNRDHELLKKIEVHRWQSLKDNAVYHLVYQLLCRDRYAYSMFRFNGIDLSTSDEVRLKKMECNENFQKGLEILFSPKMPSDLHRVIMNYIIRFLPYTEKEDEKTEAIYNQIYVPRYNLKSTTSSVMNDQPKVYQLLNKKMLK